jgi:hypothetical protein
MQHYLSNCQERVVAIGYVGTDVPLTIRWLPHHGREIPVHPNNDLLRDLIGSLIRMLRNRMVRLVERWLGIQTLFGIQLLETDYGQVVHRGKCIVARRIS